MQSWARLYRSLPQIRHRHRLRQFQRLRRVRHAWAQRQVVALMEPRHGVGCRDPYRLGRHDACSPSPWRPRDQAGNRGKNLACIRDRFYAPVRLVMLTDPLTLADRFALLIADLCRAIAARIAGERMAGLFINLISEQLRRMSAGFAALAAGVRAGTVAAATVARRPASRPRAPRHVPRGFAWLLCLVPKVAPYGAYLPDPLADPEMAALVSAAPQVGRSLRPRCRMPGVRPAPELLRPPATAAPAPAFAEAKPLRLRAGRPPASTAAPGRPASRPVGPPCDPAGFCPTVAAVSGCGPPFGLGRAAPTHDQFIPITQRTTAPRSFPAARGALKHDPC
jgi:hypothetical protein